MSDYNSLLEKFKKAGQEIAAVRPEYDENNMDLLPNQQMAGYALPALASAGAELAPDPVKLSGQNITLGDGRTITTPELQIDPTMMGSMKLAGEAKQGFGTLGDLLKPTQKQAMEDVAYASQIKKMNDVNPKLNAAKMSGSGLPNEMANPDMSSFNLDEVLKPGKMSTENKIRAAGLGTAAVGAGLMADEDDGLPELNAKQDMFEAEMKKLDPSLFERVSKKYQEKEGELTAPDAKLAGKASLEKKTITESRKPVAESEKLDPKEELNAIRRLETGTQLGTQDALKREHDRQNTMNLLAGMGDVGANFLKNITGKDYGGNAVADQTRKQGQMYVDQHTAQVANQHNDPKSQMSVEIRNLFHKMGFPVSDNVSAADLEKKFPGVSNIYTQQQAQKARAEQAAENRAARREDKSYDRETRMELAKIAAENKKEEKATKLSDKQRAFVQGLRKESTSGQYGKAYESYANAQRANEALGAYAKDPNGYTDYGTLMLGLKSLQGDSSVVREAEIKLGMNAADLATKISNWQSRIANGQSLTPEQRQQIVATTKVLAEAGSNQYRNAVAPLLQQAEEEGINPELIFSKGIMGDSKPKAQSAQPKTVIQNGHTYTWDEASGQYK